MKNKALQQILNMDILMASALWIVTLVLILGFFFKWITLVFAVIIGIASFSYSRDLIKRSKNK